MFNTIRFISLIAILVLSFALQFPERAKAQVDIGYGIYGHEELSAGFGSFAIPATSGSSEDFGYFDLFEYAESVSNNCRGITTNRPTVSIEWSGSTEYLRIFFMGEQDSDTTLYTFFLDIASGNHLNACDDDYSSDSLNPFIQFDFPPTEGIIYIWVGDYYGNTDGRLYITEEPLNPVEGCEIAYACSMALQGISSNSTSSDSYQDNDGYLGGLDIYSYCEDKLFGIYTNNALLVSETNFLGEFGLNHDDWLCLFDEEDIKGRIANALQSAVSMMGNGWFLVDMDDVCREQYGDDAYAVEGDGPYDWACYTAD